MKKLKEILNHIFIDGLSAMAHGLFATLIIGTIIQQIGLFLGGNIGDLIYLIGKVAASLTGAGIGVAVASKFGRSPLVVVSAATAGMVGAFASNILSEALISETGAIVFAGPGEPLGAFIAAFVGITVGGLVAGKTKVDIIVTPIVTIASGAGVGLLIGPAISEFMAGIGALVNWGTEQQPLIMGIVVSVLMGMILTLPISSAAVGIILNLSGLAAGAATVGCCCNMIGFAVASFRENKVGGLVAQGIGTSMLQVPNIVRKPLIWLPAILSSAILGPIGTMAFGMTSNATGSGMGTAGLVGPIMAYQTMIETGDPTVVMIKIIVLLFVLPAVVTLLFSELMRKIGWIKQGDMKLAA
ncbi:MAG: PTS transporter subunit IIC [Suipraeoptans sp.]